MVNVISVTRIEITDRGELILWLVTIEIHTQKNEWFLQILRHHLRVNMMDRLVIPLELLAEIESALLNHFN